MPWYKFVAKLSHSSFGLLKKLTDFLDAISAGFWLGVMGEKSLEYSDELYYNRTKYYTEDKYNESGLFEWEKVMISKHFTKVRSILLIAAGGGREVIALSKMGFEIDSYECNPSLIEFGNDLLEKNKINSRIRYLSRNSVPGEVRKYDAVIIGWGAYSLISGSKKRISFLSSLYPFLQEGSVLMVSFIYLGKRTTKEKIIKNVSDFLRFFRGINRREIGDRLVPNFIHYFTEEEVRSELIRSEFRVIEYSATDYGCIIAGI